MNTAGSHTIVVTATDGAGNTGSATTSFTVTPPAGSPLLKATSAEDVLGLTSRLVFSTARGVSTPDRSITLTNTGGSDLVDLQRCDRRHEPEPFSLADGQAHELHDPCWPDDDRVGAVPARVHVRREARRR